MPRRLLPSLLMLAVVLAVVAPSAFAAAAATATTSCRTVAAPRPKGVQHLRRPTLKLTKPTVVTLRTNCGTITIRLDVKRAPRTASSFAALVRRGFYNGLTFHRIVPGFVVQGGDPLGTGAGGPGYSITEAPPRNLAYKRGIVAMAKAGDEPAGASGSQFFIVTAADARLPPDYALVGRVIGGYAAVRRIEATPTRPDETPRRPMVIQRATVRTG